MNPKSLLWGWLAVVMASGLFTLFRVLSARRVLEGLSRREVMRVLVGLGTEALDGQRRKSLRGLRASILILLLTLWLPPMAIRSYLSQRIQATSHETGAKPEALRNDPPGQVLSSGGIGIVQLSDAEFGIRVDDLVPGGAFDVMGLRSGDTILVLDGMPITSHVEASAALVRLMGGNAETLDVKGADETRRSIAIREQQ